MIPMISPFTNWLATNDGLITHRLSGSLKENAAATTTTIRIAGAISRKFVRTGVRAQSGSNPTGPSAAPVIVPTNTVFVVSRSRYR